MNKHNLKIDTMKGGIFLESGKKQQKKENDKCKLNFKRILQTLHLRGKCRNEQVAETKKTGPRSLLFL